MASGVDPINRSFTNTRAPDGRDCTLMLPTSVAAADAARSEKLIAAVVSRAVSCTCRCSVTYPSRAIRMVYDPSGKSRIDIGVFPRANPFTVTSAFAGFDRIIKMPCAATLRERAGILVGAPDAGRDGVGAGREGFSAGADGAGTGEGAGCALAGRSTTVSDTDGFVAAAEVCVGLRDAINR
jgi:hypothetical protein